MLRKKILITVVLLLLLVINILPANSFANETTFADMPNDWSTPALENAVENGLLNGLNGKIMPNEKLTRAQMATVINRAFGAEKIASISKFSDVKTTDWFYSEMAKAVAMKTFKGSGDKLNPNNPITREETFLVIARALNLGKSETLPKGFSDLNQVSEWARIEIYPLINDGYIQGYNGKINPKGYITRAEFAQLMNNIIKDYIKGPREVTLNHVGNLMINNPGVVLKNSVISGDLIIGDGVGDGEVTLENVVVKGRLLIRGGGKDSLIIKGSSAIGSITIARINGVLRVFTEEETEIGEVTVDGSDDVIVEGTFTDITVSADDVTVWATDAELRNAYVEGNRSIVIIGAKSIADKVVVSGVKSEVQVLGLVKEIEIEATGTGSKITVLKDGQVDKVISKGEGTKVEGEGKVTNVYANANNVVVTVVGAKVIAAKGTEGVKAGDKYVVPTTYEIVEKISGGRPPIPVNTITVTGSDNAATVEYGSTLQMSASIAPSNASNKIVSWSVEEGTGSATIDANGLLRVTRIGTVTVKAVVQDGSKKEATKEIIVTAKSLTATATATDKIYDGISDAEGTIALADVVDGEVVVATGTFTFDDKNAGTDKIVNVTDIVLAGDNAANYTVNISTSTTANISKRPITITALTKTKVYGETDPDLTYIASTGELVGTDSFTGSLGRNEGQSVGQYSINQGTFSINDGNSGSNYEIEFVLANLEITKKSLSITAEDQIKTYGETHDLGTTEIVTSGLVFSDTVDWATLTSNGTDAEKSIGNYDISPSDATGTGLENYSIAYSKGTLTVVKRQISVVASEDTKTYDGTTASSLMPTVESGSVAGGETGDWIQTFNSINAGPTTLIPSGNIKRDGIDVTSNYDITFKDKSSEIRKRDLILSNFSVVGKVYDGTTVSKSASFGDNRISGDILTFSYTEAFDTKDAGERTVNITDITVGGKDEGNYTLITTSGSATTTITPAPLTITAESKSKTYDGGVFSAFTVYYGSFVADETQTVLSGELKFSGGALSATNVGMYTISPSGLTSGNYTITFKNSTLTINKATPVINSWPTASKIVRNQPLLESTLTGGNASIEGSFAFQSPTTEYSIAGTYEPAVVFVPKDSANYNEVEGSTAVEVQSLVYTGIDVSESNGSITLKFSLPVYRNTTLEPGDFEVIAYKKGEQDELLTISKVNQPDGTTSSFKLVMSETQYLRDSYRISVAINSTGVAKIIDLGGNTLTGIFNHLSSVDRTALSTAINAEYSDGALRNISVLTSTDYTETTWTAYTNAIAVAREIEGYEKATQDELDAEISKISTTKSKLVFAGKSDLDAAIASISGLVPADYTTASWNILLVTLEMPVTTNAEVVAKTAAINSARDGLAINPLSSDASLTGGSLAWTQLVGDLSGSTIIGEATISNVETGTIDESIPLVLNASDEKATIKYVVYSGTGSVPNDREFTKTYTANTRITIGHSGGTIWLKVTAEAGNSSYMKINVTVKENIYPFFAVLIELEESSAKFRRPGVDIQDIYMNNHRTTISVFELAYVYSYTEPDYESKSVMYSQRPSVTGKITALTTANITLSDGNQYTFSKGRSPLYYVIDEDGYTTFGALWEVKSKDMYVRIYFDSRGDIGLVLFNNPYGSNYDKPL